MEEIVKNSSVIFFLTTLAIGFIAGFGAYKAILSAGAHEVVKKGSYILNSDIIGKILRPVALKEIEHLIEMGESLDAGKNPDATNVYMLRAHTFINNLQLEKDTIDGKRSFVEEKIDHIIRDIPNRSGYVAPLEIKVNQIVGVLKGLKSSLSSNVA